MEVEDHFLGGWVAEPVRFRAVGERDIFGGEALLLGECGIKIIKIRGEIAESMSLSWWHVLGRLRNLWGVKGCLLVMPNRRVFH